MKFSIITAVKNNKTGLLTRIECVRNQTYKNIEHIIVDGGSTDGGKEILRRNLSRFVGTQNDYPHTTTYSLIIISEADSGIYDALNKGLKMATGDVVGFLHSDDIFKDENVISKIAKAFEEKGTDSVYSDLEYVYKNDPDKILRYWKSGEFNPGSLNKGWMPPHPTFCVKKNIYDKFGMFDTSFRIAADYEIILRFLAKQKISTTYLPEVTIKMRAGGASNKNIASVIRKSREDYRALKINAVPFPLMALFFKNARKINQFVLSNRN